MSKNIKISTSFPSWPLIRQTPSSKGEWGGYFFMIDDSAAECDAWVVYDDIKEKQAAHCPEKCLVLVTAEPPEIRQYPKKFLEQFDLIITSQPNITGPNVIHTQTALPWYVGWNVNTNQCDIYNKNYDELSACLPLDKSKLISIVTSRKTKTKAHWVKLDFISHLTKHFGDKLDVFGAKFNQIADKWDAVAPYTYHLAIENSICPDYWTEKLTDAFLGDSYPIYFGCPNITEYFPPESLSVIDIYKPDEAMEKIDSIIRQNLHGCSVKARKKARELILNRYQFFPFISAHLEHLPMSNPIRERVVYPLSYFSNSLIARSKAKIQRMLNI